MNELKVPHFMVSRSGPTGCTERFDEMEHLSGAAGTGCLDPETYCMHIVLRSRGRL